MIAKFLLIWLLSGINNHVMSIFPVVGPFPLKFSIAPSGKTTDQIKKARGTKMGQTSSITMPSMVGIMGRAPAVDEKVMLFVCLFVTFWNYKYCDNGNAMKQCYFQNNYGVIAYRKVCSCVPIGAYSLFNFFCRPPGFSHRVKFIPKKIPILGAVGPHFSIHNGEIWHDGANLGLPPQAKFSIHQLRGYTFLANLYQKLPMLGAVSPHFKSDSGEIWREGTDLGHLPLI